MNLFKKALPVWVDGREDELNLTTSFIYELFADKNKEYSLNITGAALYSICINGLFVHYGPAKAPHGYARVDSLDLCKWLNVGLNTITIDVAGYRCYSYYLVSVPSFLQAEVLQGDEVIAYTDIDGDFTCSIPNFRTQKVMRYSFQRTFTEIYNLDNNIANDNTKNEKLGIVDSQMDYLHREFPIPNYNSVLVKSITEKGKASIKSEKPPYLEHRFIHEISQEISGFMLGDIEDRPFEHVQDVSFDYETKADKLAFPQKISTGEYVIFDMGLNNNGFILSQLMVKKDSEVLFLFDEKLVDGKLDIVRWESINIVKYSLKAGAGEYNLQSFESYGYRYIMCYVVSGDITLKKLGMVEYSYPHFDNMEFTCDDEDISKIFIAAQETYRQNTVDCFMDCPTRERAGWLCDSYFTGQSSRFFSGSSLAEKVFLHNFTLAKEFPALPKGMLPMCYPSDHVNGNFIPQWAMWYIIELEGYLKRDANADIGEFSTLCYDLVEYFVPFKNSDGLLENLDMWNFIEWSKANEWVDDVNYPTNMLYSRMLGLVGTWFNDDALKSESAKLKQTIIDQSFNGEYFIDNSVRKNGELVITNNISEVCQYYAIFFGIVDVNDESYAFLMKTVKNTFGPWRRDKNILPEITYANAFIGNYLRMEILLQEKEYGSILKETKGYFSKMASTTGTLWEHDSIQGSLNHGFASFIAVALVKAMLGIVDIDEKSKTITLDLSPGEINAQISMGIDGGKLCVSKTLVDGKPVVDYSIPDGYKCILI